MGTPESRLLRIADLARARSLWSASHGDTWVGDREWLAAEIYLELLHIWSGRMSLISQADCDHLATRHLLPSLAWLPMVSSLPHARILDLGSGAGLPGVPLAISLPHARVYLVESRRRRAHFLREASRRLGLGAVEVVNARAEEWSGPDGGVDLVVSRAVGSPREVVRLAGHCMAPHAHALVLSAAGGQPGGRPCAPPPGHAGSLSLCLVARGPYGAQVIHSYPHAQVDNPDRVATGPDPQTAWPPTA